MRTAVLRNVGYFSEIFGFYGIDSDLTAKVLLAGHDVVFTKQIALHHYRSWPKDRQSPAYAALAEKQQRSVRLYDEKYGRVLPDDPVWNRKRAVWNALRTGFGRYYRPNSRRSFFGAIPRDWHNMFMCRYIALKDAVRHRGKDYHLCQHVPPHELPAMLPDDPILTGDRN